MFRNPAVLFTVLAVLYFLVAFFTLPTPLFIIGLTGIGIVTLVPLTVRYAREAYVSFRRGARFQWEQLAIAIFGLFAGLLLQQLQRLFFRAIGQPEWAANSILNAFIVYALIFFLILYLHATRKEKEPPSRVWWTVTAASAVVALVIGWVLSALGIGD